MTDTLVLETALAAGGCSAEITVSSQRASGVCARHLHAMLALRGIASRIVFLDTDRVSLLYPSDAPGGTSEIRISVVRQPLPSPTSVAGTSEEPPEMEPCSA